MTTRRSKPADFLSPYSLPLSAEEIRWGLGRGLGRVVLHHQAHGLEKCADDLLYSCLHSQVYDRQCEAPRAPWLWSLLDSNDRDRLLSEFKREIPLSLESGRHRDLEQQIEFCQLLAQSGVAEARQLLYDRCVFRDGLCYGGEAIVTLDGLDGFRFLIGRLALEQEIPPYADTVSSLWQTLRYSHGDEIAATVLSLVPPGERRPVSPAPSFPLDPDCAASVLAIIDANQDQPYYIKALNGKDLQISERCQEQLAHILGRETDSHRLFHLLKLFQRKGKISPDTFDKDPDAYLQLLQHPEQRIRYQAYPALGRIRHSDIRKLALRLVKDREAAGVWDTRELMLFSANYQPGDADLLMQHLSVHPEAEIFHHLVSDLTELSQQHLGPEWRQLLIFVYQSSPCANCRGNAYQGLASLDVVPDWIACEWPFDVDNLPDELQTL